MLKVRFYAEKIEKSIKDLEVDKELEQFIGKHLGKVINAFAAIGAASRSGHYHCRPAQCRPANQQNRQKPDAGL